MTEHYSLTRMHKLIPGERPDAAWSREERLSKAWQAIVSGKGSREDADLAMGDLANFSGYFGVSQGSASNEELQRAEGRREVMARILFLLDLPMTYMTELRRAALDALQVSNLEGE